MGNLFGVEEMMSNDHEVKLLNVSELSKRLHWSTGTIRNRICRGDPMPPHIKIGRRLLFPAVELELWIEQFLPLSRLEVVQPRRGGQ